MTVEDADKTERMATLVASTRKDIAMRSSYIPTDRKTAMQDSMLDLKTRTHWALVALLLLVAIALGLALFLILFPSQPVATSNGTFVGVEGTASGVAQ